MAVPTRRTRLHQTTVGQEEDARHYGDKSVDDRIPSSGETHLLPSCQTNVYVLMNGGASCEPGMVMVRNGDEETHAPS